MQTSFDSTLIVIFDNDGESNLSNLLEFFTFNNLPTTIVSTQREFWSKIRKSSEYSFDYILTIDGNSKEPEDFSKLFEKINDAEIVIGQRQGNYTYSKLFNLTYFKWSMFNDWFSPVRLYRIETLLNLNKYTFSDDLESFQFETLAKSLELGCAVAEVEIKIPLTLKNVTIYDVTKYWYSLLSYKNPPTYNEQSLY